MDPLLKAPWGLRDPRHLLPGGSQLQDWILRYPGGWQSILPNFGPACEHQGIEHPMHGEAAVMPWTAEIVRADAQAVEVRLAIDLILTPLELVRHVRLERGARVLTIAERLANVGAIAVEYVWGHHPALGAPFLSPACRIDAGARTLVVDGSYEGAALPLQRDSRHEWGGAACDEIRHLPPEGRARDLVAYLHGFEQGWWAVTNRELGVGFGLVLGCRDLPRGLPLAGAGRDGRLSVVRAGLRTCARAQHELAGRRDRGDRAHDRHPARARAG